MNEPSPKFSRNIAIVGPFSSGKTALLESMLFLTGKIGHKGNANDLNRIGDQGAEAKKRQMGIESVISHSSYLDEEWTIIDTPGSIEFMQSTYDALVACDIAIVCADPDPDRALMLTPILKFLDENAIPHLLFINKIENRKASLEEIMIAIQATTNVPLIRRQLPIMDGDKISGYVDLSSDRAYKFSDGEYEDNVSKHLSEIPKDIREDKALVRQEMMEALSDYNDEFMEMLLEDRIPSMQDIYKVMKVALSEGNVMPVFFGSAELDYGVKRLLKAIRHDCPSIEDTKIRLEIDHNDFSALCFKTHYAQHSGKLSLLRIFNGSLHDGAIIGDEKISGMYKINGEKSEKISQAELGDVIAIGKVDLLKAGDIIYDHKSDKFKYWHDAFQPLFAYAIFPTKKGEEVKLSSALNKLIEEDASYNLEHNQDSGEMLLWGQGEIHLKTALSILESRFNVSVEGKKPKVPYKETIKASIKQQGRHKKQSGGAGQFGDIHIEIKPLARGEGFQFINSIVGGVVPKNYIPAIEEGCIEYTKQGPLGFPLIDLSVNLYDGSYHSVDSSDQAFKMAAILAMKDGIPQCKPIVLEPILSVTLTVPSSCTSNAQRALSQRRGQILSFDRSSALENWDVLSGFLPQSEMHDLIIELRSLTMGVGSFSYSFDHLQELTGREADEVIAARKKDLE